MKRILILTAVAAAGAVSATCFAGPLERKDVAADPALLTDGDIDALKSTSVGKTILAEPDVQTKLAAVQAMFNFDLRTQLHGFTIYTTTEHPQVPALIVYADFDPDRLLTLAKAFPGFDSDTNGGRVTYSWDKEKKDDDSPRVYAAIAGHRVVFGKERDALLHALDVIDGKSDSFKGEKMLLEKKSGDLVVAEGALRKMEVPENNPASAVFQSSKVVRFQLGESGDKVGATVSFEAKDADAATQINAMVNGLLALVKIQKDNGDPNLMKLANAINVRQDDATVLLSLTEPSADLVQMIKEGAAKQKEKEEKQKDESEHKESADQTNAPPSKS